MAKKLNTRFRNIDHPADECRFCCGKKINELDIEKL